MSDLSKFIPKKYQKKTAEDQMIKPIASLNIPNAAVNQASSTTNGQLNQANVIADVSLPKLPNQSNTPSPNFTNTPIATNNLPPTNDPNLLNNNDNANKGSKKNKVKASPKKKKTTLLLLLLLFFLVAGGVGLILMRQPQDIRQEAYGPNFCSPANYGSICLNDPSKTWRGRCVLIYCPNGVLRPGKCSESDPNAYWEFGD